MSVKPRPNEDRFLEKIDQRGEDACWPWRGAQNRDGYGVFTYFVEGAKKTSVVSRLAFEYFTGQTPGNLYVLHSCDNPTCCNPKHLFLGTPLDNMQDKMRKGRGAFPGPSRPARGSRHGNALLTEEQVAEVRRDYVPRRTPLRVFAEKFGVRTSTIYNALRDGWKHVEA